MTPDRAPQLVDLASDLPADRHDLAADLDRMAAAFTALSSLLLAAPEQDTLDQVRDAELLAQWPGRPCPESRDGITALTESAAGGEDARDVRRDHAQLFVGPERMAAAPYESVHLSEERLIFEQETFLVRAAYAAFDLAAPRLNQEPDDHIGLEMGFIGALCVRGLDAIDDADDTELRRVLAAIAAFLDTHLLAWGPQCLTLVVDHAQTAFYRGVGSLGLALMVDAERTFGP